MATTASQRRRMSVIRKKMLAGEASPDQIAELASYDASKSKRGRKPSIGKAREPSAPAAEPVKHRSENLDPAPDKSMPAPTPDAAPVAPAPAAHAPAPAEPPKPVHCGDPNCVACTYPPGKVCAIRGTPIHARMNRRAARRAASVLLGIFDLAVAIRAPDLELRPIPTARLDELAEGLEEMAFRRAGWISQWDDVLMVGGSTVEHVGSRVGEFRAHAKKVKNGNDETIGSDRATAGDGGEQTSDGNRGGGRLALGQ